MTIVSEHKTCLIGSITTICILLVFCQISTNVFTLSLGGATQFSITSSIFVIFFFIIEKSDISPKSLSFLHYLILGLISTYCLSLINAQEIEKSAERLIVISATIFLTFAISHYTLKPQKFFFGIVVGVIIVTSVSIFYSIIAAVYDFNFINQTPYEHIKVSLAGLEFQQTIAHRSYINGEDTYYSQRYAGIFPNPNGLGLMAAISFSLSYCIAPTKARYFVQVLSVIGLAMSLSRMGIMLFSTALIYYHLRSTIIRHITCLLMIVGLFVFLIGTATSVDLTASQNYQVSSEPQQELFQIKERAHLVAMAWQGFLEHKLVGVGFGIGAEYLFPVNADTRAVHSVFLNAMLETGLIGTTMLIAVWLLPIFTTKTDAKKLQGASHQRHVIAAVLFGLFFAQAFDLSVTRFHYIHIIFFLLIGSWSALGRNLKESAIQDVQSTETPYTTPKHLESCERPNR